MTSARRSDAVAIAATSVVFAGLALGLAPEAPLHVDTARHVLGARACLESGYCPSLGPPSTFAPFVEGAAWTRVWEGVLAVGAPPFALLVVVALAHAVTAALVAHLALDFTTRWRAVGVGALAGIGALGATAFPVLWNPAIVPVASAVALTCTVASCAREANFRARLLWCVVGGAAIGIGMSAHLSAVLLLGVLGWAILAFASPPLPMLATWIASSALAFYATSRDACVIAVRALGLRGLLGGLGALVVGAAVARRLGSRAPSEELGRKRYVLRATAATTLASSLLAVIAVGQAWSGRYFVPLVVVGAAAVATGLEVRSVRWAVIALGSIVAFSAFEPQVERRWRDGPLSPTWSMDDSRQLALRLAPKGFRRAYPRVVGPRSFDLVAGIAAFAPVDASSGDGDDLDDLLVLRMARDAGPSTPPPGWQAFGLSRDRVAWVATRRSFVDRGRMRLCVRPKDGAMECVDGELAPDTLDRRGEPMPLGRAYPEQPSFAQLVWRHRAAIEELRYSMRLRSREGEPAHLVMAVRECEDAPWEISVEGVEARRIEGGMELPAAVSRRDAWIHFTTKPSRGQRSRLRGWPADYVELRADEAGVWQTLLESRQCDGEGSVASR